MFSFFMHHMHYYVNSTKYTRRGTILYKKKKKYFVSLDKEQEYKSEIDVTQLVKCSYTDIHA